MDGEIQLQFATEEDMAKELERRGCVAVVTTVRTCPKDKGLDQRAMTWRGSNITALGLLDYAHHRIMRHIDEVSAPVDDGNDEEDATD